VIGVKESAAVMSNKALVIIDIQNDITKHYRDIIENINSAIDWAMKSRILPFIWGGVK